MDLNKYIRDIPDFPEKGIIFKDITPLLKSKVAYTYLISKLYNRYKKFNIDIVIGIEARGFIFGSSLATRLKCGFVPIRKKNKLPYSVLKKKYKLEYGYDTIEIHKDSIKKTNRVLLIDDVIATGGTVSAAIQLLNKFKCNIVECCFILEIEKLQGIKKVKEKIKSYTVIKI